MRGIGLIVAGYFLAACGGPGGNDSDNGAADIPEVSTAQNAAAPAEPPADENVAGESGGAEAERVSPCQMQGADRLRVAPIRAIGTEPFWGARVEGRCITYSTPENQQGTRIWTRHSAGVDGQAAWVGQLDGKPFEMRVRPQAGCSDGMSDNRYPMAVELSVNGEQRRGCAEPL